MQGGGPHVTWATLNVLTRNVLPRYHTLEAGYRCKANPPNKGWVKHDTTMHLTDEYALNSEVCLTSGLHSCIMQRICILNKKIRGKLHA